MSGSLPTVLTTAGLQPQSPTSLNSQVTSLAATLSPGITTNLPGSLVEDMSSTATAALVVIDQARVDLVNSMTPYGANAFILNQLGQIYGVQLGVGSNTSVFVVFSGPAGYIVQQGFVVSDGTYQYVIQNGGVIGASLQTQPLFALATQIGSWAVPVGTVTNMITSVPSVINLTVTNPLTGTPSTGAQTEEDYRAQVLQAGLVSAQGMTTYLKVLLLGVNGVIPRLVSVRQQTGGGWEVICGGSGDPYQIAYAVFQGLFDISTLVGSVMTVTGITNANPAVVTTGLNHGLTTGQATTIAGATGMAGVNTTFSITVISQTTFSIPLNTTTLGTYTGNGVVTPNFRNVVTNIYDYPDIYTVPTVIPPAQTVTMTVTWNTSSTAFISAASVAAAAQPALAAYVNQIPVGQPMNQFELNATFQAAVSNLIPLALLTRMVFSVSVNGVGVTPQVGTGIIAGDPESYFTTTAPSIVINQG